MYYDTMWEELEREENARLNGIYTNVKETSTNCKSLVITEVGALG